jgi:hypothetical protein
MKITTFKWLFLGLHPMSIVPQETIAGGGGGAEAPKATEGDDLTPPPAVAATPAVDAPAIAAPAAPAVPVATGGLVDRILASVKSKGDMQAEVTQFRTRAETAESELARVQGELATANSELTKLRLEQKQIQDALTAAENDKKTVAAAAADIVAQTGIPAAELPAQSAEATDFDSRHKAAMKAGPRALGKFMRENKAEIREQLRKQG